MITKSQFVADVQALTDLVNALPEDAPPDMPPVWLPIPPITFMQGSAAEFDLAPYISDPDDPAPALAIESGALAGVTLDAAARKLIYDGIAAVGAAEFVLSADDGR